jgi:aconitase A
MKSRRTKKAVAILVELVFAAGAVAVPTVAPPAYTHGPNTVMYYCTACIGFGTPQADDINGINALY